MIYTNLPDKSPEWYCKFIMSTFNGNLFTDQKTCEQIEQIISQDAHWSYEYAWNILRNRWSISQDRERKEHIISRSPEWSFWYTCRVIKGRWPLENDREEKEQVIGKSPEWSYRYARYVIKGRWPVEDRYEKEKIIFSDSKWSILYSRYVIQGRQSYEDKRLIFRDSLTSCISTDGRWADKDDKAIDEEIMRGVPVKWNEN